MLDAIVAGKTDPEQLAQLANKRVRTTRATLAEAQRRTCNTSSSWGSTVT
jgi:hypothetical protein